jgi:curved DNA-binding protein CbpA
MQFFNNITTLDALRKEYHRLALIHHPDRGGDLETMKALNNEFERLSKRLINGNADFTEARKSYETQVSEEIMEAIGKVLNLPGLDIEIIGSWVWLTGNTFPHRQAIKEAGYKFSHQKTAWYWHAGEYRKRNGKLNNLDDIRYMFGSEKVNPRPQEEKAIA